MQCREVGIYSFSFDLVGGGQTIFIIHFSCTFFIMVMDHHKGLMNMIRDIRNNFCINAINFKVKGQAYEVKKVKNSCPHDNSKTSNMISTKISWGKLLGIGKNWLNFGGWGTSTF